MTSAERYWIEARFATRLCGRAIYAYNLVCFGFFPDPDGTLLKALDGLVKLLYQEMRDAWVAYARAAGIQFEY